jgi:hypothetical protein
MARFRTLAAFGLASMVMIGAPAIAASPQHQTSTSATAAKPAAPVKLAAATPAKPKAVTRARPTHLAKATLRNGKQVTYDCRLAGNKTKQACKG